MMFQEAAAAGIFDQVAPSAEQLLPTAKAWLTRQQKATRNGDGRPRRLIGRPETAGVVLGALDRIRGDLPRTDAAAAVAEAVEAGLARGWEAALEVERRQLVRLRHTPAARAALEAFFAKGGKK
jgi:3-hydroxyacyl-CoA dehydrogenase/enoyl-CoA hydratase/3-hydroxybutyryl-CoA epimerase